MQCKEVTVIDRTEDEIRAPEATEGAPLPPVTDRASWQAQLDEMAVREKAHTREGDAIAAARRRLPMVEIDGSIPVIGERGRVRLLDVFEDRRQLVVYYHMWHDGKPAEDQCEGCTFFNGQVSELSYLHARDVTYATFSQGRYEESAAYRRFMGYDMPWYSARESEEALLAGRWFGMLVSYLRDGDRVFETYWTTGRGVEVMVPAYGILDRTIYGRQEPFEDSPEGWPQHWVNNGSQFRTNGRPSAQWSRLAAGRSDDLTASPAS
jgi:predicted dithiol-disulfide oxidoreductase (DUF899 family)